MHTPPEGLQVGDELTQADIEAQFDTGFGYRISGINPRRDDQDNRYILLFAAEDGPYDDTVTHGQFEYIGEGLEGDQSETSPGNAALIDAITTDIPIYFFYSDSTAPTWEYQGRVDVQAYHREQRSNREVLVFTMTHRDQPTPAGDAGLYLIPVSDAWRERFRTSVERPHDLRQYDTHPAPIAGHDRLRIWGTTATDAAKKQAAIDQLRAGDCLLFYHDGDFIAGGTVGRTFEDPAVGELLWGNTTSRYLFTIEQFTHGVPPIERVWELLGYEGRPVVQGFTRVADDRLPAIRAEYGSVAAAMLTTHPQPGAGWQPSPGWSASRSSRHGGPPAEAVHQQREALEQTLETTPSLTADRTDRTTVQRRARDRAFRTLVRDAYDNTCAICGRTRETPTGRPEVEAAHIYPKAERGSDDPRNGLALCRTHHWAFDTGWLAATDEYNLLVAEAPGRTGYHEFKQLEGQSLRTPTDATLSPHPIFLEQHRLLHNFAE